ncbi:hypothetical protein, partial [Nitrobacter winogradskyi]
SLNLGVAYLGGRRLERFPMTNEERCAYETMKARREARDTHPPRSKEYAEADKLYKEAEREYYRVKA